MTNKIPDLWGDEITPHVLTPRVILRAQVSGIERRTAGLLEAEVNTLLKGDEETHNFDLIARAIGGHRERILIASHRLDRVYPVKVQAVLFTTFQWASSQNEFMQLVGTVLKSPAVLSSIQSLIARSNEATAGPDIGTPQSPTTEQPQS